ncbi:MAG: glutaredoxin family protein [Nanoarchaeota archaeon]
MTYKKHIKNVRGRKHKGIFLFALTTCGWCQRTKGLLDELGVEYNYVDVDLLNEEEQDEVIRILEDYDADASFPKTIIDENFVISGFDEEEIRRVLE